MGVPKFFRYISERYPCLSEFVQEYQIPDFDNLYLDMNGIIHNCSHPDDNNPHFRITEEKIFQDIFHYIEILFQMIKPSKVFFMAVDGVAPRAKMNQQRGRRFRSAKDALKLENEAIKRGEKLPTESRFDSNCITPGTEFMAKLQEQLQYFVVKKVSEDPLWQRCKIILSGHETPGEGEHKIMDFIRYKRSQPDYDPNTRHCLYGLDADLIMLGLCTHDPHFSLLREEVKFGKKAKKTCVPEEIRFYLLHLSLMREYLELEFSSLKGTLKNFEFDIEKIIDDWVLMGFLVGNDFIPNLPNLHITNGALPVLYGAYMDILPKLDGYINEGGILNLERFEIFMKKLGEIDLQNFEEVRDDLLYMEAKTGRKMVPFSKHNVTKFRDLEEWKPEECDENSELLKPLEEEKKYKDSGLMDLIAATEKEYLDDENEELTEEEEEESDEDYSFRNYKKNYYMNKLEYSKVTSDVMKSQAEGYVRAIQWNLHYYYNGVCSWSWYYPHHYSPYISDIKNFKDLELNYDIGKPFMPYEQLLAVLPAASKKLLPKCYQNLMTDENSPIKMYYPEDFETDLNGKKQEWEAVVLVPFIDEKILLDSMDKCSEELSVSEVERNKHSPMLCYSYVQEDLGVYKAPMYFPTIPANHAKLETISIGDISVPLEKLVKGAYPGVLMDVYYPGFPTFKHLDYTGNLKKAKVKVFDQPSLGENMVIQVIPTERVLNATIPLELLGKTVYVGWPHLIEATVMELMSSTKKYIYGGVGKDPIEEPSPVTFNHEVENMINHYFGRLGIEFGKTIIVVKAKKMIGQKYLITAGNKISLEKIFSENLTNYPLQLIVEDIQVYGEFRELCPTLESLFPVGSSCFCLTHNKFYGSKCIIKSCKENSEQTVCVNVIHSQEPNLSKAKYLADISERKYKNLYMASEECSMPSYLFSRITGCVFASARNKEGGLKNVNFGLDLKYNKKNLETPDYTKRINGVWYYTDKTIDAVYAYANAFPEIFDYLFENSKQKRDTSVEDIFSEDSDEKTKLVLSWLKSQPFNQIEKRPCNSNILDTEVVDEIEKALLGVEKIEPKEIEMSCKATFLYKSELCFGNMLPDQHVEVQLLDRIVNVRPNYTVPFGLKGTVIGIRASSAETSSEFLYDVLFDDKFEGGIDVNSSLGKGYRLPLNSFINISHGVRLYQANKERKPRTSFSNHNRRDEFVPNKYQNFANHNKITNHYVNSPHSAFAKFNNQQTCGLPSYNAVPPYMPNNEYIYKSDNFQFQNNRRNYNPHNQNNYSKKEENVNIKIMKRPTNSPKSGTNLNNKGFKKQTLYRDSENNVNIDSSNFENMSKKQDFMPAFRKEASSVDVQETADALKKILKISTDVEKKDCKVRQIVYNSPSNVPNNNQKENPLHNKKTDSVEKIEKRNSSNKETLSSVELFNYYQCKGLGLPRYQYITTSDKRIQSQIKLPNRQIIIGQAASTRLEATEFVAKEALKILSDDGNVKSIPSPPKQWWALETDKKIVNNTTKNTSEKDVWKKFIPLQVTKKKNVNSNSTITQSTMSPDNKKLHQTSNEKAKNSSKDNAQAAKKRERKPKKMRIAANFALSPSSQDK